MSFFWFLLNCCSTAVNAYFYAATGEPLSLAAAVFCGLIAVFHLVWLVVGL